MRTRRSPLNRIMDLPGPSKALLGTASTVVAFPLRQAEKVAKKARSTASAAASLGVQTGLRAMTGVADALSSVRGSTGQTRAEPPAEPRVVAVPPPPRAPESVPPRAAARLLEDTPAEATEEPSELHRPGQDVFPIKHYPKLTAPDAIAALRTLERQADVAAVLRHEQAHRNRKSVTAAAEARIGELEALDVRT
jgi:hypothetical protein